jgi:type VI secretion system lysozyme-like protein
MRDIEWLLNSRCHAHALSGEQSHLEQSVYTYGLRDIGSFGAGSTNAGMLVRAIRQALERFEPRLKNVSVTEEEIQNEPHVLRLIIAGEVEIDSSTQQISLETRLELSNGECRVHGARG